MTRTESGQSVHLQVYVRSLRHTTATGADVIDRVRELTAQSPNSYDVFVWGDRAPPSPAAARTTAGQFVLGRIAVFRTWADRNGVSLGPGLELRTVDSTITGERFEELVLPRVALAVFQGEDLVCVAPHSDETSALTVPACLDALGEASQDTLPAAVAATLGARYEPLQQARERPPSRTGPRPAREGVARSTTERTVSDSPTPPERTDPDVPEPPERTDPGGAPARAGSADADEADSEDATERNSTSGVPTDRKNSDSTLRH